MEKIISRINSFFQKQSIVEIINKIPTQYIVFIVLSCFYLDFRLSGNEENYMQLAKQFFNPKWIYQSQNLTEFPGTRIVYQFIIGFLLQYFSFENLLFFTKLFSIILLSAILAKIYSLFEFKASHVLFHLVILFIGHQSLFAGSWMFVSVESKMFAYLFILSGFYFIAIKKNIVAFILLIISTYFHVLVGFYATFYLLFTLMLFRKEFSISFKQILLLSIIYVVAISPFIIYLTSALNTSSIKDLTPKADWIYTYFRNPHHTALYLNFEYFFNNHLTGVFLSVLGLLFLVLLKHKIVNNETSIIANFTIVSLLGTVLLVSLAYFDREGKFLKYYPYRINTLSTFFLSIFITHWLFNLLPAKNQTKIISFFGIIISIYFLIQPTVVRINTLKYLANEDQKLNQVCEFIKTNTNKEDVILSFDDNPSITRKTERSRFAIFKFIPADLSKVHQWYYRILDREKVLSDISQLKNLLSKYRIDYIISLEDLSSQKDLKLTFSNEKYKLYKVISK